MKMFVYAADLTSSRGKKPSEKPLPSEVFYSIFTLVSKVDTVGCINLLTCVF